MLWFGEIGGSFSLIFSIAEDSLFVLVLGSGNMFFLPNSLIFVGRGKEINYSVAHILTIMG